MGDFDASQYEATIDAILRTVNLEEITAKRLRKGLEGIFGVDLTHHKKEMDTVIMERYVLFQEELENAQRGGGGGSKSQLSQEESDAVLAAKLQSSFNKRQLRHEGNSKPAKRMKPSINKTPSKRSEAASKRTNGFNAPLILSDNLANIVGAKELSRPQVVKKVWEYIKANNLQNPNDRREIICDDTMSRVFGSKTGIFSLNKVLKNHMAKPDELANHRQPSSQPPLPYPQGRPSDDEEESEEE